MIHPLLVLRRWLARFVACRSRRPWRSRSGVAAGVAWAHSGALSAEEISVVAPAAVGREGELRWAIAAFAPVSQISCAQHVLAGLARRGVTVTAVLQASRIEDFGGPDLRILHAAPSCRETHPGSRWPGR